MVQGTNNQKALHEELDGKIRQEQVMPDAEESIKFWSELWDNPVNHDRNAELITTIENNVNSELKLVNSPVINFGNIIIVLLLRL